MTPCLVLSLVAVVLATGTCMQALRSMKLADRRVRLAHATCDLRLDTVALVNRQIQDRLPAQVLTDDMVAALRALDVAAKGVQLHAD